MTSPTAVAMYHVTLNIYWGQYAGTTPTVGTWELVTM